MFIRIFLAALLLFVAVGARAEATNDSVQAIIQGRKLVLELLQQRPAENFAQTGILKIRDAAGNHSEIPVKCAVTVTPTNWQSVYEATFTNGTETLVITHSENPTHQLEGDFPSSEPAPKTGNINLTPQPGSGFPSSPDKYFMSGINNDRLGAPSRYTHHFIEKVSVSAMKESWKDHVFPFAGSDFWECDLGLEFLHWPAQKVLPNPTNLKRGREYTLLESTNPNPSTNGYSRVLSWIDKETGGILQAEAYDAQGKLLKEFAPKSFKKVNGQWELQEMEIDNVQTGSRTRLEFDVKQN